MLFLQVLDGTIDNGFIFVLYLKLIIFFLDYYFEVLILKLQIKISFFFEENRASKALKLSFLMH